MSPNFWMAIKNECQTQDLGKKWATERGVTLWKNNQQYVKHSLLTGNIMQGSYKFKPSLHLFY